MADSQPYIGTIMMFAGNFAPKGYAFCQGQILAIAQNTALFSLLGTTFGGNGTTTFALPDLQGRGPMQQGQGPGLPNVVLGEQDGSQSVTLTQQQLPAHTHSVAADSNSASVASPAGAFFAALGDPLNPVNAYSPGSSNTTMNNAMLGIAGGSQPIGIQNPFLGLNFIIALVGIYPSRN
jgi:microcystin-dependent protein